MCKYKFSLFTFSNEFVLRNEYKFGISPTIFRILFKKYREVSRRFIRYLVIIIIHIKSPKKRNKGNRTNSSEAIREFEKFSLTRMGDLTNL
jgi:hypothetical protein